MFNVLKKKFFNYIKIKDVKQIFSLLIYIIKKRPLIYFSRLNKNF